MSDERGFLATCHRYSDVLAGAVVAVCTAVLIVGMVVGALLNDARRDEMDRICVERTGAPCDWSKR